MILIDTCAVVGLVEPRDGWHRKSCEDLAQLRGPFGVTDAVLVEAYFLLTHLYQRQRLHHTLGALSVQHIQTSPLVWRRSQEWIERYHEHQPDCCDALLIQYGIPIWTHDNEFRTIWRTLEGAPVPLALGA